MTHNSIDVRGDTRPALTSLRFVAALLVFITHIAFLSPFANPSVAAGFNDIARSAGHLGVSFFFVLSGFVLTWSAGAGDSLRAFYRRRFVKIVPNHLVVFVGAVGLTFLIGMVMGPIPYLLNLFLIQPWFVFDISIAAQSPNAPVWSLGAEVFFYALFPLFFLLVKRIRQARVWTWWVSVGVLILAVPVVFWAVTPSGPPSPAFEGGTWLHQSMLLFFPITRLPDFLLGILTARLVLERRFVGISVGWAAVITAVAYVIGWLVPAAWAFAGLWGIPVALLIGAAAREGRKPGLLESRPAVWAGEVSYAFFLVHMPFMIFTYWLISDSPFGAKMSTLTGILFILGMIVVTLLVSRLLYVAVERPAMRRWSRPRTGPDRQPITGGGETTPPGDAEPDKPGRIAA